jgi:transcriptional regulator
VPNEEVILGVDGSGAAAGVGEFLGAMDRLPAGVNEAFDRLQSTTVGGTTAFAEKGRELAKAFNTSFQAGMAGFSGFTGQNFGGSVLERSGYSPTQIKGMQDQVRLINGVRDDLARTNEPIAAKRFDRRELMGLPATATVQEARKVYKQYTDEVLSTRKRFEALSALAGPTGKLDTGTPLVQWAGPTKSQGYSYTPRAQEIISGANLTMPPASDYANARGNPSSARARRVMEDLLQEQIVSARKQMSLAEAAAAHMGSEPILKMVDKRAQLASPKSVAAVAAPAPAPVPAPAPAPPTRQQHYGNAPAPAPTADQRRYEIPYTAPSGGRGTIRVTAETPDQALAKAVEIHSRKAVTTTPALGWDGPRDIDPVRKGPPGRALGSGVATSQIPKRDRLGMFYGDPVVVTDSPAQDRALSYGAKTRSPYGPEAGPRPASQPAVPPVQPPVVTPPPVEKVTPKQEADRARLDEVSRRAQADEAAYDAKVAASAQAAKDSRKAKADAKRDAAAPAAAPVQSAAPVPVPAAPPAPPKPPKPPVAAAAATPPEPEKPGPPTPLQEKIAAARAGGASQRAVMDDLGVTRADVQLVDRNYAALISSIKAEAVARADAATAAKKMSAAQQQQMITARANGATVSEMASKFGMTLPDVSAFNRENRVAISSAKEDDKTKATRDAAAVKAKADKDAVAEQQAAADALNAAATQASTRAAEIAGKRQDMITARGKGATASEMSAQFGISLPEVDAFNKTNKLDIAAVREDDRAEIKRVKDLRTNEAKAIRESNEVRAEELAALKLEIAARRVNRPMGARTQTDAERLQAVATRYPEGGLTPERRAAIPPDQLLTFEEQRQILNGQAKSRVDSQVGAIPSQTQAAADQEALRRADVRAGAVPRPLLKSRSLMDLDKANAAAAKAQESYASAVSRRTQIESGAVSGPGVQSLSVARRVEANAKAKLDEAASNAQVARRNYGMVQSIGREVPLSTNTGPSRFASVQWDGLRGQLKKAYPAEIADLQEVSRVRAEMKAQYRANKTRYSDPASGPGSSRRIGNQGDPLPTAAEARLNFGIDMSARMAHIQPRDPAVRANGEPLVPPLNSAGWLAQLPAMETRVSIKEQLKKGFGMGGGANGEPGKPFFEMVAQTARIALFYGVAYRAMTLLQNALASITQETIAYEGALTNLNIATGRNRAENAGLASSLSATAAQAGFSPSVGVEAGTRALGLYGVADAPQKQQEALAKNATTIAMRVARVSGADPLTVNTQLAGALRAFGWGNERATVLEDAVTYMAKHTGQGQTEILGATANIATLGKSAGFSPEQLMAIVAQTAATTGQNPEGTAGQFRQVMSREFQVVAKAAQAAGLDTSGLKNNEEIFAAMSKMNLTQAQTNDFTASFGKGGSQQVATITLQNWSQIEALAKGSTSDPGNGERAFDEVMLNIGSRLKELGSTFLEFGISLTGTGILDWIVLIIDGTRQLLVAGTNLLNVFNLLPRPMRSIALALGEIYLAALLFQKLAPAGMVTRAVQAVGGIGYRSTQVAVATERAVVGAAAATAPILVPSTMFASLRNRFGGTASAEANAATAWNQGRAAATALPPVYVASASRPQASGYAAMNAETEALAARRSATAALQAERSVAAAAASAAPAVAGSSVAREAAVVGAAASGPGLLRKAWALAITPQGAAVIAGAIVAGLAVAGYQNKQTADQAVVDVSLQGAAADSGQKMRDAAAAAENAAKELEKMTTMSWSNILGAPSAAIATITTGADYGELKKQSVFQSERAAAYDRAHTKATEGDGVFNGDFSAEGITAGLDILKTKSYTAAQSLEVLNKAIGDIVDSANGTPNAVAVVSPAQRDQLVLDIGSATLSAIGDTAGFFASNVTPDPLAATRYLPNGQVDPAGPPPGADQYKTVKMAAEAQGNSDATLLSADQSKAVSDAIQRNISSRLQSVLADNVITPDELNTLIATSQDVADKAAPGLTPEGKAKLNSLVGEKITEMLKTYSPQKLDAAIIFDGLATQAAAAAAGVEADTGSKSQGAAVGLKGLQEAQDKATKIIKSHPYVTEKDARILTHAGAQVTAGQVAVYNANVTDLQAAAGMQKSYLTPDNIHGANAIDQSVLDAERTQQANIRSEGMAKISSDTEAQLAQNPWPKGKLNDNDSRPYKKAAAAQAAIEQSAADRVAALNSQLAAGEMATQQAQNTKDYSDKMESLSRQQNNNLKNINPGDSIGMAAASLDNAKLALTVLTKDTAAFSAGQKAVTDAQYAYVSAVIAGQNANRMANIDPRDKLARTAQEIANTQNLMAQLPAGDAQAGQYRDQITQLNLQQAANVVGIANSVDSHSIAGDRSGIDKAKVGIEIATRNLGLTRVGTEDYWNASTALVEAKAEFAQQERDQVDRLRQLGSDITDPVAQAINDVKKAQDQLAADRASGQGVDTLSQDSLDLKHTQASAEQAAFSQRISDLQTAEDLGRITHTAYIGYLQSEHDRLAAIAVKTRQQQEDLDQVDKLLKSAGDALQGQFNIGDIKLPTIYEVRRAMQSGAPTQVGDYSNSNNVVNINGAPLEQVVEYLKTYLGAGAQVVMASTGRKI